MKKVFAICLMLVLVVSLSVTAFAAPNGFISSPSENPAPEVEEFKPSDEACTAELVITPYGEREELSETLKTAFEKAYNVIVNSTDLSKLNADLAKIAADKGIAGADLVVSDLFDIHVTGCDYHDGHTDFDVTLDADTLKHFVGLLHMKKDGTWELVSDAKVVNNGEHLQFSVESFSPFAIIVNKSAVPSPTGDSSMIPLYSAIMAVSALAMAVIVVKGRKLGA